MGILTLHIDAKYIGYPSTFTDYLVKLTESGNYAAKSQFKKKNSNDNSVCGLRQNEGNLM